MILKSITEHIWNTPLLLIPESVHGISDVSIYAKLEFLNPFWSVKDRTALGIIKKSGNKNIIESSSGNTGKALGILASIEWRNLLTVTNRIKQKETEDLLKIIWVKIKSLPPWSECPDPNDPSSPFWVIKNIVRDNPWKYYWTDQYTNIENPKIHHDTTAWEIYNDIWIPDFFFSWLGTTGSSRGIIEYFQEKWSKMKNIGIITASGSYIPWIRNSHEMAEVGLFIKKYYTDIIPVNDQNAIDSMLILIRKCGILAWPTTGAIYHGLIHYLNGLDKKEKAGKKIVFIACDRIDPYMSYLREKRSELFENTSNSENKKSTKTWVAQFIEKNEIISSKYTIIDMRSYASFELGHITWSISFPFFKLQEYVSEGYLPFSKTTPLVFICPYGEESSLMSQIANGLWYNSYSLKEGYQSV